MRKIVLSIGLLAALFVVVQAQPALDLIEIATGLSEPVDITNAGDARLFVVEKPGRIRVIDPQGNLLSTPFLNIVSSVNDSPNERGLLGLAFHPDYATNGYFFVNYTGDGGHTRVSRFSVSEDNPNEADPDSEVVLMVINQPYWNHNGGDLNFGPDGYLYIGMGDGGSADDPQNNGQTLQSYLGKLLRIDVDNAPAGSDYGIPADNPFADPNDNIPDEIWAYGLRNPWRFSFDRLTGDLWIGDVGQYYWEEVDFLPAGTPGGSNFGWRCYEGFTPYLTGNCDLSAPYVEPLFVYSHDSSVGCSITGGFMYRGCTFPDLYGYYLYVDYCTGRFWGITSDGAGGWENVDLINSTNLTYSSFGEGMNGELYLASLDEGKVFLVTETTTQEFVLFDVTPETCSGDADGAVVATWNGAAPATYAWSNGADTNVVTGLTTGSYEVTVTSAAGCAQVHVLIIENGDPGIPEIIADMTTIEVSDIYSSYQWYLNGNPIAGATTAAYEPTESGTYSVEVTNELGCTVSSEPTDIEISGLEALVGVQRVELSPNPISQ
ncbi:MAG: PQQ-dependent sugar dehydrogenase, partial [Phaeodactylibacter sp.]|nr:PQQ-dependent sugar dehydrogenase [Phaeodactylibacter sp.]